MSTKDKTRSKLMDSMRKTKASANSDDKPETVKAETKPAAAEPKKAAPAKSAPKKAAAASSGNYSSRGTMGGDAFESGARIWPD